jgi:recombination protein RecA
MTDRCRAIIIGSVLGDGSLKIHTPYRNARFAFRHSAVQRDYFFWKAKELKEISSARYFWEQPADGWGTNTKFRYQSRAMHELTELFQLIHPEGQFQISDQWLHLLVPLSLAVWWMDDGSLVSDSRQGVFCTDGFSLRDIQMLQNYLEKKLEIKTGISHIAGTSEPKRFRLWISSTAMLVKFLRLIAPSIVVPSMLPKVIMLYKDQKLQKRWISEISYLTTFPITLIEQYAAEKRSKWAKFRE